MKRIWSLVLKDIRRLWPVLAVWTALVELHYIGGEVIFHVAAPMQSSFSQLQDLLGTSGLLVAVMGYALAGFLLLEDPLVGTRAYWLTRPISGWRLLTAKITGLLLIFVVWRVVLSVPWWLHAGFDAGQVVTAIGQLARVQIMFLTPALVLASVTGTSGRFFLWTAVALVAWIVVALIQTVNVKSDPGVAAALMPSRARLANWIGLGAVVVVVVMQYTTRRTVFATTILVVALAAAVGVGTAWPWTWPALAEAAGPSAPGTEPVAIAFEGATLRPTQNSGFLDFRLRVEDLPADLTSASATVAAELQWADGTTTKVNGAGTYPALMRDGISPRRIFGLPAPKVDPETEQKPKEMMSEPRERRQKRGQPVQDKPQTADPAEGYAIVVSAPLTVPTYTRLTQESPTLTLRVRLNVGKRVVLGEMPLVEGASFKAHGVRAKVVEFTEKVVGAKAHGRKLQSITLIDSHIAAAGQLWYYRINRGDEDLMLIGDQSFRGVQVMGDGFGYAFFHQDLPPRRVWRTDHWVEEPALQPDDRIAAVVIESVGTVVRTVSVHGNWFKQESTLSWLQPATPPARRRT